VTNEQEYDIIEPMETTQVTLDHLIQENPMGEARKDALRLVFNQKLKLEFPGTKVTSDGGLPIGSLMKHSACGSPTEETHRSLS